MSEDKVKMKENPRHALSQPERAPPSPLQGCTIRQLASPILPSWLTWVEGGPATANHCCSAIFLDGREGCEMMRCKNAAADFFFSSNSPDCRKTQGKEGEGGRGKGRFIFQIVLCEASPMEVFCTKPFAPSVADYLHNICLFYYGAD